MADDAAGVLVEYALLLALVAIAAFAALAKFGNKLNTMYSTIVKDLKKVK